MYNHIYTIVEDFIKAVVFTSGNVHDSKMVEQVTKNLKGSFFCDAGYLKTPRNLLNLPTLADSFIWPHVRT